MSILVVGALHHDVIVETPGIPRVDETLPGKSVRYAFGGKGGNQAVQAARLGQHMGVPVAMAGCIGRDAPGNLMLETLMRAGVDCVNVQRVDAATGMSVALSLPDGSYGAVIVSSSNLCFDYQSISLPHDLQWLILQNELPEAVNLAFAQRAKGAKAKVLLNAAPARAMSNDLLQAVDVLVVNKVEAADILSVAVDAVRTDTDAVRLRTRYGCDAILTLGGDGLVIAGDDGCETLSAYPVDVISTHGAGDAFIGALAVRLCSGDDLVSAARFANVAAALHVSTPIDEREQISAQAIESLAHTSSR